MCGKPHIPVVFRKNTYLIGKFLNYYTIIELYVGEIKGKSVLYCS